MKLIEYQSYVNSLDHPDEMIVNRDLFNYSSVQCIDSNDVYENESTSDWIINSSKFTLKSEGSSELFIKKSIRVLDEIELYDIRVIRNGSDHSIKIKLIKSFITDPYLLLCTKSSQCRFRSNPRSHGSYQMINDVVINPSEIYVIK